MTEGTENTGESALVNAVVMPRRIQLSRRKGFRNPDGVVVVSRPSRWGNPFRRDMPHPIHGWPMSRQEAVDCFREWLIPYTHRSEEPVKDFLLSELYVREIQRELRGKDLACWCPLDQPCHADVLIEIANGLLVDS